MNRVRLAILISGRGSNMEALLEAAASPAWPAQAVLVASNRPEAPGLERARSYGVEALAIDHRRFPSREAFEAALDARLHDACVDLVALAGFMRVLTAGFVARWEGRLINIHPSLLPNYPGLDTHARALAAGDKVHGCSVHFVTSGVDEGPVIGRAAVEIVAGDTEASLAARVLKAEHALFPRCVEAVARGGVVLGAKDEGDLVLAGDRVRLSAGP